MPARVLNLVVIVDRDWRGEIQNRLDKVGSYHASRTILVSVEPGRTTIDASAAMTAEEDVERGELAVAHEHVVLDIGEKHLKALDTIVDPLVVSDLATLLWSPHGHHEGVDAMAKLAQIILIDSVDTEGPEYAVRRSSELAERHYVVDLAWLRSTPWRERVASTFDPGQWRPRPGVDRLGDRAPQARLGDGRAAAAGLAVLPAGLGAGPDDRARGRRPGQGEGPQARDQAGAGARRHHDHARAGRASR